MAQTPKDIAELLLDGQSIPRHLSASELEDVTFLISRKLEGDEGYQLLLSPKVRWSLRSSNDSIFVFSLTPVLLW